MPLSPSYRPSTSHAELGEAYYDVVDAASFPQHILRYRNQRWAERVGLGGLTDTEWAAAFGRFEPLPGNQAERLAMRYHGHQFRVYNPDLGDGSSLRASRSPVSTKLKDFDVSTPRASSISVARTSRTPPLRVRRPSPLRDQGVWPLPFVPRSRSRPSWRS